MIKTSVRRVVRLPFYFGQLAKLAFRDVKGTFCSTKNLRKVKNAYARGGVFEVARLIRVATETPAELGRSTAILASQSSLLEEYAIRVATSSQNKSGIDLEFVPKASERIATNRAPIKAIAFYLPQFHPIPENDAWWGEGFTEWTNVTKAVPQYVGHHQPQLPIEVGFYDLRLVEVMEKQALLADWYGIGGFCFHYYWFGGKRLLERPIDQYLASKTIKLPFCFCWANENWTRRWDGQDSEVLIAQQHSPQDDIAFIEGLFKAFADPRYIRHDGKPVLVVYRVSQLPDAKATANRWRQRCREAGIGEIYLIAARSFEITDPRPYGFDAAIEFPPHQIPASNITDRLPVVNPHFKGNIFSYEELADHYASQKVAEYPLIKTVSPGWDNEARRPGAGHIFHGSSPAVYATWLRRAVAHATEEVAKRASHPPFVFINAWNEWAEGAHLEPDRKYGYAYLHATANVLRASAPPHPEVAEIIRASQENFAKRSDTAVIAHLYYDDLFEELRRYIANVRGADIFMSLRTDISPERVRDISAAFPDAQLAIFPNRGRDILPFLPTLRLLREHEYEFACKIHGKKSPQRTDGAQLRRGALNALLGSETLVESIRQRFQMDPALGVVAPMSSLLDLRNAERNVLNRQWLDRLFSNAGMDELIGNYGCRFAAGSMFWFRVKALEKVDQLDLRAEEFEEELGQVDGTLAHALERIFVAAAEKSGFRVEEVSAHKRQYEDLNG